MGSICLSNMARVLKPGSMVDDLKVIGTKALCRVKVNLSTQMGMFTLENSTTVKPTGLDVTPRNQVKSMKVTGSKISLMAKANRFSKTGPSFQVISKKDQKPGKVPITGPTSRSTKGNGKTISSMGMENTNGMTGGSMSDSGAVTLCGVTVPYFTRMEGPIPASMRMMRSMDTEFISGQMVKYMKVVGS